MKTTQIDTQINQIGKRIQMPTTTRNYIIPNQEFINTVVQNEEAALPKLLHILQNSNDEREIVEGLYAIDRLIDVSNDKDLAGKIYPTISRHNCSNSANVQTMLAGIYRKTQVPDAFGPLCSMLIKNTFDTRPKFFDPNEEIGGAILEYLRNNSAIQGYRNSTKFN